MSITRTPVVAGVLAQAPSRKARVTLGENITESPERQTARAARTGAQRRPRCEQRPPITTASVGAMLRILRRAAPSWNAPVMTLIAAEERDPFKTLIGCVLSLRTKDETTGPAARRLFALAGAPQELLKLKPADI